MVRLIKRYESRKLYDTEQSRYVSLDDLALFVRDGQEVRVVDNATDEDVTAQTLTQVILEEGKNGRSHLPSELLHELLRAGGKALTNGVEQVQHGVDRFIEASFDRLGPVRKARTEMDRLRSRLEDLESSLAELEQEPVAGRQTRTKARRSAKKKSTTAAGTAAKTNKKKAASRRKKSSKK